MLLLPLLQGNGCMTLYVKDHSDHLSIFSFLCFCFSPSGSQISFSFRMLFRSKYVECQVLDVVTCVPLCISFNTAVTALCVLLHKSNAYEGDIHKHLRCLACPIFTVDQQIPFCLHTYSNTKHKRDKWHSCQPSNF